MEAKIKKVRTSSAAEAKYKYSRIVAVDNWIFVSNTAGRNPTNKIIPYDIEEQTFQVFANIEAALASVDSSLADVVNVRIYIYDPKDTDAIMQIFAAKFEGTEPTLTSVCPPLCSTEYRVEIEVTAWRGAGRATTERIALAN
jgi:enamine deaminase RidA (YjgF/YER057c/UK114 family)